MFIQSFSFKIIGFKTRKNNKKKIIHTSFTCFVLCKNNTIINFVFINLIYLVCFSHFNRNVNKTKPSFNFNSS